MIASKAALGDVASIERSSVAPGEIQAGDHYVGLENITSSGEFIDVGSATAAELKSNKFRFGPDHILYGKLRPYLAKIAQPDFAGVCSTDIVPIRPGPSVDARYLLHFLRTPQMVGEAERRSSGANLPRLSPQALSSFEVPLPSIEDQRRVATLLDSADALRAKRREAVAKLDTLNQAVFIDMFGDPVSNPMGWPVVALSEWGELDRGVSKHRPRNDPSLLGGDWPLIQTGDVSNANGYIREFTATYSDLGLAQSRLWPAGTLCITIAANIAKTGILTVDACFPDSVVGFTSERPERSEYVRAFIRFLQPLLERQAPESAQKNINLRVLRSLQIPAPPDKLVVAFAAAVSSAAQLSVAAGSHSAKLDALFGSLQQRAFRGAL